MLCGAVRRRKTDRFHFRLENENLEKKVRQQRKKMASAAQDLLQAAFHASSGVITLDATGSQDNGRNALSSYPPANRRLRGSSTSYYDEDKKVVRGEDDGDSSNDQRTQQQRPAKHDTHQEQSISVGISLLHNAAVETPASLDPSTARANRMKQYDMPTRQSSRSSSRDRRHETMTTSMRSDMSSRGSRGSRLETPGLPLGFMSGGQQEGVAPRAYDRKRVVVARKRCYISNVASFEAFSTTEAEVDIRRAVDNLMESVRADQLVTGGPTRNGELWKTIESFFDAIPFVGLESGAKGEMQFTQYIRCMSALREAIRIALYDKYDPDRDHRTLIPCFSALELARETIKTLEMAVLEAEKAVVDSVMATKTDVIMAFKKLKPIDREDLRVYLEKREDFKRPKTPKISEFRTYGENKRKGIPRSKMNGSSGAAAKWLLGGGNVLSKLKTGKMESQLQSQHIEIRRLEWDLSQAHLKLGELQESGQKQGQHKLMSELCDVLGVEDSTSVHADDIIGRVKRMRRRNVDSALSLFERQGNDPENKERMKKLVELLDITTFESGSVEEEIVLAVEKLVRQTKMNDQGGDNGEDSGGDGRKFRLKSVGLMIQKMSAKEKSMLHTRDVVARKQALKQKRGAQKASKKEVKRFMKGKGPVSNEVSLCGLLRGLTDLGGGKQAPSGINVNNSLAAIYQAKYYADLRADKQRKERLSLAQYLRTFLVHQYGVKKLAMKQMMAMIKAIKKHRVSVPRLNLFARLVGLDEKDEETYSSLAADYFIVVLVELFRAISVKKIGEEDALDIAGMMRDGITKKRLLTSSEISQTLQNVDMGKNQRQTIMSRIQQAKSFDVDSVLTFVMDSWYEAYVERLAKTEKVFFDSDENDDGELTLDEFMVAVRVMEPNCPEEDVVELYDRIAGDDGVIDAEEFAGGVMILHSHMIQNQRRIREERREAKLQAKLQAAAAAAGDKGRSHDRSKQLQPHPPAEGSSRSASTRSQVVKIGVGLL